MATTRKGWRKIVVDGATYKWSIRKEAGYWNNIARANMHFTVESASGALLIVELSRPRLDYWMYPEEAQGRKPVTPYEVAQEIKAALGAGWNDEVKEKPFFHKGSG